MKNRQELIKKYIDFFKLKDHKEIPNVSLVPLNDPTVLFVVAGMQPLVPYLTGQKHPLGKRLVNVQKCIRTIDIDEVGDDFHLTFFEMLGNWSLGDYFKKEAIEMSYELLTKTFNISEEKISVTCFKGDKDAPKDQEAADIWKGLGIKKIKFLGKKDNWWGPAGETGPCGPDTEMFINDMELWNDVFMQYNKVGEGKFKELEQKNVDTGMGVERALVVLNKLSSVYETSTFQPIIKQIEKLSKKKYGVNKEDTRSMRIIADHIKASVFILAEDILPNNTEQGYVLRRLIRRAIIYGKKLGLRDFTAKIAEHVFPIYPDYFPKKDKKVRFVNRDTRTFILDEIDREEMKFAYTLERGLKFLRNMIAHKSKISGKDAFLIYQSYGFPLEMTQELAKEKKVPIDVKGFEKEFEKHQKLSRVGAEKKFKGGLSEASDVTAKLHTATHLLGKALRKVLKSDEIKQKGSNINPERLRYDFNFDRKVTEEEQKKIEDEVNKQIKAEVKVSKQEMETDKAIRSGAQAEFGAKYPAKVWVYSIGNYTKDICMGPHVENTSSLGKFKIVKEESVAAGIRRIKAVLE